MQVYKIVTFQVHLCDGKGISVLREDLEFCAPFCYSVDSAPQYLWYVTLCQALIPLLKILIFFSVSSVDSKARTASSLCTCTLTSAWHGIDAPYIFADA